MPKYKTLKIQYKIILYKKTGTYSSAKLSEVLAKNWHLKSIVVQIQEFVLK